VFLDDMRAEFPDFAIVYKRDSALQRAIGRALTILTFGGQRVYLTRYYTVLFGKLWVPDSWDRLPDLDRYVLLRHELVHLRQRRRFAEACGGLAFAGDVAMGAWYLLPLFPLGLAWGRARIEWEAYVETMRATAEVYGVDAVEGLRAEIVRRFVGPDYGWMWPFPRTVNRWFDDALGAIRGTPSGQAR